MSGIESVLDELSDIELTLITEAVDKALQKTTLEQFKDTVTCEDLRKGLIKEITGNDEFIEHWRYGTPSQSFNLNDNMLPENVSVCIDSALKRLNFKVSFVTSLTNSLLDARKSLHRKSFLAFLSCQ
jgi:hypothetical protein